MVIWVAAAIVFVALLALYPRFTIGAVLVASAGGAIFIGLLLYNANQPRAVMTYDDDLVTPQIRIDSSICSEPKFPIFVAFINNSTKTVKSVLFSVDVKQKGFSSALGTITLATNDKILAPKEGYGFCYAMPSLSRQIPVEDMNFELQYKSISFQY